MIAWSGARIKKRYCNRGQKIGIKNKNKKDQKKQTHPIRRGRKRKEGRKEARKEGRKEAFLSVSCFFSSENRWLLQCRCASCSLSFAAQGATCCTWWNLCRRGTFTQKKRFKKNNAKVIKSGRSLIWRHRMSQWSEKFTRRLQLLLHFAT